MPLGPLNPKTLIEVPPADLGPVLELYDRGLYLQAYEVARGIGPVAQWTGTAALLIGSRLAGNLGAPRLARWLSLRAYRNDPRNLETIYFYVSGLWRRRGPLLAWRSLEALKRPSNGSTTEWANLLGLRARIANAFRDFETAERCLEEAQQLEPANLWVKLDRAFTLEEQDDYEGALAASRQVLTERPWFRPAVQTVAHHLQLLSRDDEALDLLRAAMIHLESEAVAAQLAVLETELGLFPAAMETLGRYRTLAPLSEAQDQEWWHGQMSDVQYKLGDIKAAAEHARAVKGAFFEKIAARLSEPNEKAKRVHLAVGFVRQHRMTCAPATITALSHFWRMPVDHLSLASAICYDGTPDHVERHWLEQNGWVVAEFKVTWEATMALLDRSIPFTVSTVETESAHLQAVIGYDQRRGTLLARDPYERVHREFVADAFFERYAAFGPRGLAFLPKGKESLLSGIELPEAALHDDYYQLRRALERHDREAAERCCEQLKRVGPSHRLALQGRRMLALYDANEAELLAATEELLSQFPNNGMLSLSKLASLRDLGRRPEYLAFLKEMTSDKDAEPAFLREYARELLEDASRRDLTRLLLIRATRSRPTDADSLHVFAGLRWEERNFIEAAKLYRLAACVADKTEYLFRSYFTASRHVGEAAVAIAWLQKRFEQFGRQSSLPARTLFWALNILDRASEGFDFLEQALLVRPEDGELLTFATDEYARVGRVERAMELLTAAQGRASRSSWLRSSGTIAENQNELNRALQVWREVLALEPLALDANRAVARLIAEVDGRVAAVHHLQEVCARFSHHLPLHKLWLEWTRDLEERERILRLLLRLSSVDAWTHRELALLLAEKTRFEEAHEELLLGRAIEPMAPGTHTVAGRVLHLEGRNTEAAEAYRRALALSVDAQSAVDGLLAACATFQEKRDALEFIFQELKRQVAFGDGLLAYRDAAYPVLEPKDLLANLREALAARPDLWHAWSAVVAQLSAMNQLDEALEVARGASERFPLLPRTWYDLAHVHKARREPHGEIASLERALELNSAWGLASRDLSAAQERLGQLAPAETALRKAIEATPSDPYNRGCLADLLWRRGERETAVAEVHRAVLLNPDYDWGWQALRDWSTEEGDKNLALQTARELVATRSGESRSWLRLADALQGRQNFTERLSAMERALALNPRNADAWDTRATILAEEGRYQEALDSCRPAPFEADLPVSLRGRSAWVEAHRGRMDEAIEQMRTLLDEAPDYYWGWARLADWHMEQQKPALALEATEQMSRLQPGNVAVLGYLGDARVGLERREEAKEAFRHAWDLDPLYSYGAHKLFELELEDQRFAEAEAILQKMKRHLDDAQVIANEVRLAARQSDKQRAFAALDDLCRRKGDIAYALLHLANNAVTEAGWGKDAGASFARMLRQNDTNPDVGGAWVRQVSNRGTWFWWKAVHQLRTGTVAQKEAMRSLINAIGDEKRSWLLRYLLWRLSADVRRDDIAWGNVGYAMANMAEYRRVVRWMEDWRTRSEVQPWMLLNLAGALGHLARAGAAREASLAALELPVDHTKHAHCLLLAHDEAIRGNFAEAERYRTQGDDGKAMDDVDFVASTVKAMLELHHTPPAERARALKGIRSRLREEVAAAGRLARGYRRMYRHTLLRLAQDGGDRLGVVGAYLRTLPRPHVAPAIGPLVRVAIILLIVSARAWWPWVQALFDYLRSFF